MSGKLAVRRLKSSAFWWPGPGDDRRHSGCLRNDLRELVRQPAGTSWHIQRVSCRGNRRSVHSVGRGQSNTPLIERWRGSSWHMVPAQAPPGSSAVGLTGVAAVSGSRSSTIGTSRRAALQAADRAWERLQVERPDERESGFVAYLDLGSGFVCHRRMGRWRRPVH